MPALGELKIDTSQFYAIVSQRARVTWKRSGSPARKRSVSSSIIWLWRKRACTVTAAICGSTVQFSSAKNGESRSSGNFSDCFERRHAGPMTAYRVVRFPNPIVPMKQFAQRKRLGRWRRVVDEAGCALLSGPRRLQW